MSEDASKIAAIEARIAVLDQEIKHSKAVVHRIEAERAPFKKAEAAARWYLLRLQFLRWIRGPAQSYNLWKLGLLITGTASIAAFAFVLADLFSSEVNTAVLTSIAATVSAGVALATLMFLPCDSRVTDALVEAEIEYKVAVARLAQNRANDGLQENLSQLNELMAERQEQLATLHATISSEMGKRRALLQQDWRAMRDYEWEEFLVRVFHALGANARRIGGAGDQGVDLIVEIGARRIAVQAKGYLNSVSNKAIQEAFTGMVHHKCTDCAVITNSRFTQGAHDIAGSTGCILVGEDEFADLVVGKIALLEFAKTHGS